MLSESDMDLAVGFSNKGEIIILIGPRRIALDLEASKRLAFMLGKAIIKLETEGVGNGTK